MQPGSGNDANNHGNHGTGILSDEVPADNGGGYDAWIIKAIDDPANLKQAIAVGSVRPTLPEQQRPRTHPQPRPGQEPG